MKFTCSECESRYNIPDQRVAGKILQIRCKKCGHINSVDGSAVVVPTGAAATPSTAQTEPAPPPPVGLPLANETSAPPLAEPSDNAPSIADLRKGTLTLSLADLKLPEDDAPARVVSKTTQLAALNIPDPEPNQAPFAEVKQDPSDDVAAGPTPESTRMAIAQAGMAHRAAKHRTYAAIAVAVVLVILAAMGADAMGYIEIPFLHRAVVAAKQAVGVEPREKKAWTSVMTEEERAAIRKALLEGNSAEVTRIKQTVRRRAQKKAKEQHFDIDLSDQNMAQVVTADDLKRHDKSAAVAIDLNADQAEAMQAIMRRGDVATTRINVRQNIPEIKVPKRHEGGLSAEQIGKVVAQNQGGIQFCATQETKRGLALPPKLTITVTVVGYGKVTRAKISDANYAQAPLGRCLVGKAKIWKFPEFTGEPMDIEIPLKFTTVN